MTVKSESLSRDDPPPLSAEREAEIRAFVAELPPATGNAWRSTYRIDVSDLLAELDRLRRRQAAVVRAQDAHTLAVNRPNETVGYWDDFEQTAQDLNAAIDALRGGAGEATREQA